MCALERKISFTRRNILVIVTLKKIIFNDYAEYIHIF